MEFCIFLRGGKFFFFFSTLFFFTTDYNYDSVNAIVLARSQGFAAKGIAFTARAETGLAIPRRGSAPRATITSGSVVVSGRRARVSVTASYPEAWPTFFYLSRRTSTDAILNPRTNPRSAASTTRGVRDQRPLYCL